MTVLLLTALVASSPIDLSHARPYEVVSGPIEIKSDERFGLHFTIYSVADTKDEFGQTCMRAALDLQEEHGATYTMVVLTSNKVRPGGGPYYGQASFAVDGLGTKGIRNGVDQHFRYVWDVRAVDDPLSDLEMSIIEAWAIMTPRYPLPRSRFPDPWGHTHDYRAIRQAVADSLGLSAEDVGQPRRLPVRYYLK